jgi:hypothetical protein
MDGSTDPALALAMTQTVRCGLRPESLPVQASKSCKAILSTTEDISYATSIHHSSEEHDQALQSVTAASI